MNAYMHIHNYNNDFIWQTVYIFDAENSRVYAYSNNTYQIISYLASYILLVYGYSYLLIIYCHLQMHRN